MIGIKNIGSFLPHLRISNTERASKFFVTNDFVEKKIGIRNLARKEPFQKASGLCVNAIEDLLIREKGLDIGTVDFLCVCTENSDFKIPFTAAIVHDELQLSPNCSAFDINLGCSGYVYSLEIARTFMEANGLKKGLVFTADPYSEIIDENDKNTEFLFGDGATVTLLSDNPAFCFGRGVFKTYGNLHTALIKKEKESLVMNGRKIFNFVLRDVPGAIQTCLDKNKISMEDVDVWLLHQASRFLVESLSKKLKIPFEKVPFEIQEYGNTVSSSIPFLLKKHIEMDDNRLFCMSGFGVGLSIATNIIKRI